LTEIASSPVDVAESAIHHGAFGVLDSGMARCKDSAMQATTAYADDGERRPTLRPER